jgi:hypothetical protein
MCIETEKLHVFRSRIGGCFYTILEHGTAIDWESSELALITFGTIKATGQQDARFLRAPFHVPGKRLLTQDRNCGRNIAIPV